MRTQEEIIFSEIFAKFLDRYEDSWIYYQDKFQEHVEYWCFHYQVSVERFYEWLNRVVWGFIEGYVHGVVCNEERNYIRRKTNFGPYPYFDRA